MRIWQNETGIETPAVGFSCFAYIYDSEIDQYINGYKLSYNPSKDLQFSQSGLYSYDATEFDSLKSPYIEYLKSDQNGFVSFPHIQLSKYGPANQNFKFDFFCFGALWREKSLSTLSSKVLTSIDRINVV